MSISQSLGAQREVSVTAGTVRYRERGSGEPLVFVHGALVNGDLWRDVVPPLAERYRCVTPDWPLGAHLPALAPDAELSAPGLARIVVDVLDALGIGSATLVGNDTGGAICQVAATEYPQRVARLVLTDCDAFDICPPRMFSYLTLSARIPGAVFLLAQSMRLRPNRRLPIAFGWLSKRRIPNDVSDGYVRPIVSDAGVRRDATKLLKALSPRVTLAAAEKLPSLRVPTLIAWAREDKFFPFAYGQRLAETIPGARFEAIEDSLTFVPEDQPERLAGLIDTFLHDTARAQEATA